MFSFIIQDTDGSGEDVELTTFGGPTTTFGTDTGTFGRGAGQNDPFLPNNKEPNGHLQQSRSTDYSSSEESSSEEEDEEEQVEDSKLMGNKYKHYPRGGANDDVFTSDGASKKPKDVNVDMDAYLDAYDQALNPFSENQNQLKSSRYWIHLNSIMTMKNGNAIPLGFYE